MRDKELLEINYPSIAYYLIHTQKREKEDKIPFTQEESQTRFSLASSLDLCLQLHFYPFNYFSKDLQG